MTMTLTESADGRVIGTVSDPGASVPLQGIRKEQGFTGTLGESGANVPITALFQGDQVVLMIGADGARFTFRRSGDAPGGSSTSPARTERQVVINGWPLSADEIQTLEERYRTRISGGPYWYDAVLGAWGIEGGPTLGFVVPGLGLGGPLRPEASGGGTQVFVNGRELHPKDVLALQQITGPIAPGRYFITSQGLAGYEGGPALWNLLVMAAQSQGGGGSTTWQGRLSSGFSDGTTGAVFLPNGGIVSTGQ
jgi:hypothetical protein